MSSSATMQQAKTEVPQTAQHSSQRNSEHAFADLRPQATAQRQLQDTASHSSQSRQLKALQQMAQNSTRNTQLKSMSEMTSAKKAPAPNNTGLPDNLKSGIESLSGMSMDHVKVHYNSTQPAQLNAHAYAQGSDIHVAPGQEQHLPHEAWHVVQQAQGRVRPTMQMKAGVAVNDDVGLEREADVMGERALDVGQMRKESQVGMSELVRSSSPNLPVIQGNFYLKGPNNSFIWHAEEPDTRLYEDAGEMHKPGLFSYSYPVYKNKLLDSRPYPNAAQIDVMTATHQTGLVPANLDQVQTAASVIGTLSVVKQAEFRQLYDSLAGYCRPEDRNKIIEGALTNVRRGALINTAERVIPDANKTMFMKRYALMVNFIREVGDKPLGSTGQKIRDVYWIQSTGSDPHAGGKHALFLLERADTGRRKLYKPHSLEFENAFMGKKGMLNSLSASLAKSKKLPTMDIETSTSTEEYVPRVGEKGNTNYDQDKLDNHSHKLGMLEIAAHVFGVTDLHGDNVIFGEHGPVPIDSEVGGAYPSESGIEDSLGPARVNEAGFLTASSLHFGDAQQDLNLDNFAAGKLEMTNVVKRSKKGLLKQWRNKLAEVDTFRVVPIATGDLARLLQMALDPANKNRIKGDFIGNLNEFIDDNELAKHWQLKLTKKSANRFYEILQNGTLPAFEFQMKTGHLLMDGVPVALPSGGQKVTQEMNVQKLKELAGARIDAL